MEMFRSYRKSGSQNPFSVTNLRLEVKLNKNAFLRFFILVMNVFTSIFTFKLLHLEWIIISNNTIAHEMKLQPASDNQSVQLALLMFHSWASPTHYLLDLRLLFSTTTSAYNSSRAQS